VRLPPAAVAEAPAIRSRALIAVVVGALVTSAPLAGCGSSSKSKASGTSVAVADFSFTPKLIHVKVGQAVTWTNQGQVDHTVKGPGFFTRHALSHGQTFSHTFDRAGRFSYLCTLHPTLMRGTVVVGG
jgi:plastocyanin